MRIISGSARGCKLAEFSVSAIRPTSDRVREAVFNILTSKIGTMHNLNVLDLYAGTGAMGLEALSRGAESATFIDQSKEAITLINKNAITAKLSEQARIVQSEIQRGILNQTTQFDLIFMDPPYQKQDTPETLSLLASRDILKTGGVLCVETAHGTPLPDMLKPLIKVDQRKYGLTSITLYEHGDLSQ